MRHQLIIGTYTEPSPQVAGRADGILAAAFAGPRIEDARLVAEAHNPSWVTACDGGDFVYAVSEATEFHGEHGGGVAAYRRNADTGALALVNEVASGGTEPAHLAVDPERRFVLVANYGGGSVAVLHRRADGGLGELVDLVRHGGSSVDPVRQGTPHPHQVVFDPVTGEVWVPDLGLDAVVAYRLDAAGTLAPTGQRLALAAGAGPRHVAFAPDGRHLFVVAELNNTLVVFRRTATGFDRVKVASTLPEGFAGRNQASAVQVGPSGRMVYAANRGHDSIAAFAFDPDTAGLTPVGHEPTRGAEPRDFIVTADGSQLIVANQNSDTLVRFTVDPAGRLSFAASSRAATPVCLLELAR